MPVQVKSSNGIGFLKDIVDIAAGNQFAMALAADGTLWTWGLNNYGQLGVGGTSNRDLPVKVDYLTTTGNVKIAAIAAGGDHALALLTNGRVLAWGSNYNGQVGFDSRQSYYTTPGFVGRSGFINGSHVSGTDKYMDNVVMIEAGNGYSAVVLADGTAYAWGAMLVNGGWSMSIGDAGRVQSNFEGNYNAAYWGSTNYSTAISNYNSWNNGGTTNISGWGSWGNYNYITGLTTQKNYQTTNVVAVGSASYAQRVPVQIRNGLSITDAGLQNVTGATQAPGNTAVGAVAATGVRQQEGTALREVVELSGGSYKNNNAHMLLLSAAMVSNDIDRSLADNSAFIYGIGSNTSKQLGNGTAVSSGMTVRAETIDGGVTPGAMDTISGEALDTDVSRAWPSPSWATPTAGA